MACVVAQGAQAQFSANIAKHTFFGQQVGTTSAAVTAVVTNVDGSPKLLQPKVELACWSPPPQGCEQLAAENIASFSVVSACTILAPGESCTIEIRFSPVVARFHYANVTVGDRFAIAVSGYGVPRQTVAGTELAVLYARASKQGRPHQFLTSAREEIDKLDRGKEWWHSDISFWVYPPGAAVPGTTAVCRFFGRPEAGLDAHFFSASSDECIQVAERFSSAWQLEAFEVFRVVPPNSATGVCPGGTAPVWRAFMPVGDAYHQYTTSAEVARQLASSGWILEGSGPDRIAMCAPQ